MGIDWDALANKAASQTDDQFKTELASLTQLDVGDVDTFIKESAITNSNAVSVLKELNNATLSNNQKANAIASIDKGVGFLVSLVGKIV